MVHLGFKPLRNVMNKINYKNPSHPLYARIQPIVSARKKGFKRLAEKRFNHMVDKYNIKRWEALVLVQIIKSKVHGTQMPWETFRKQPPTQDNKCC
jgi:hypothetical protein